MFPQFEHRKTDTLETDARKRYQHQYRNTENSTSYNDSSQNQMYQSFTFHRTTSNNYFKKNRPTQITFKSKENKSQKLPNQYLCNQLISLPSTRGQKTCTAIQTKDPIKMKQKAESTQKQQFRKKQIKSCSRDALMGLKQKLSRNLELMSCEMNGTFLQVNKSYNRYQHVLERQQQNGRKQQKKQINCQNIIKELQEITNRNHGKGSTFTNQNNNRQGELSPQFQVTQSLEQHGTLPNSPMAKGVLGSNSKWSAEHSQVAQLTANQKNLLEITSQTNFFFSVLPNGCNDSLFAYERYGPSMSFYGSSLILYGGYSTNVKRTTYLAENDFGQQTLKTESSQSSLKQPRDFSGRKGQSPQHRSLQKTLFHQYGTVAVPSAGQNNTNRSNNAASEPQQPNSQNGQSVQRMTESNGQIWHSVPQRVSNSLSYSPPPMTCFHTVDVYRNYMLLVGGTTIGESAMLSREINSDIGVYNFSTKQWSKVKNYAIAVRSHASTLFGTTLMIHGGLDEKENHSNYMHFINLNVPNGNGSHGANITNSIVLSTQNKYLPTAAFSHSGATNNGLSGCSSSNNHKSEEQQQTSRQDSNSSFSPQKSPFLSSVSNPMALAHHKIVHSNEVEPALKTLLKYDGVFCFGGVNNQGEMSNQIYFLDCISKENSALDVRFQSWIKIQCLGLGKSKGKQNEDQGSYQNQNFRENFNLSSVVKPNARKNHSMNILNKKALIVIIGGEDAYGNLLSDVWTFDLVKLEWRQISLTPQSGSGLSAFGNSISSTFNRLYNEKQDQIRQSKGGQQEGSCNQVIQGGISGHATAIVGTKLFVFGGRRGRVVNKRKYGLWCIETDVLTSLTKKIKYEKSINASINTIRGSNKGEGSMWNIDF